MSIIARANQAERAVLWPKIEPIQNALLTENASWLKEALNRTSLLDKSLFGSDVSQAAWLIVQHADHDTAWQIEMLDVISRLYREGKFGARNYALMVDRVAVNSGEQQTFGSQGQCKEDRKWHPKPIEAPNQVDARRAEVGLMPMAKYLTLFRCD